MLEDYSADSKHVCGDKPPLAALTSTTVTDRSPGRGDMTTVVILGELQAPPWQPTEGRTLIAWRTTND